ncbi:hypothetical protein BaRGS_00030959 [Batillaria attramentaria]|uniref:Uncharacterized protein n=1 Tax=Batillaria attramentaria TaxID=370345 RepID=A0ABD0JSB7_9CAEN
MTRSGHLNTLPDCPTTPLWVMNATELGQQKVKAGSPTRLLTTHARYRVNRPDNKGDYQMSALTPAAAMGDGAISVSVAKGMGLPSCTPRQ